MIHRKNTQRLVSGVDHPRNGLETVLEARLHAGNQRLVGCTVDAPRLKATAQRRIQRIAREGRDGNAEGDDAEVWVDAHDACGLALALAQRVVALRRHEEAAVLQRHLAVLEEIVEHGHDVALHLLEAFDDEHSAVDRGANGRLVRVCGRAAADDLAPLLQVRLRRVLRKRDVLHLAAHAVAEHQREPAAHRAVRAEQVHVLAQHILAPHPPDVVARPARPQELPLEAEWDDLGLGAGDVALCRGSDGGGDERVRRRVGVDHVVGEQRDAARRHGGRGFGHARGSNVETRRPPRTGERAPAQARAVCYCALLDLIRSDPDGFEQATTWSKSKSGAPAAPWATRCAPASTRRPGQRPRRRVRGYASDRFDNAARKMTDLISE